MENEIDTSMPITLYGNLEKFNETISKGRARVFYKGLNRNRTFINDDFAEKLIASAPYAPVKGIYDAEEQDYTDHGTSRNLGKIYGVIPENPNFAWEKHTDEDGVEREYACFDVLLYTALYGEAASIVGKGESMELYKDTLQGDWKIINGQKCFEFTDGCFLGLQALGDNTEPCFEGASFYDLQQDYQNIVNTVKSVYDINPIQEEDNGGTAMPTTLFKLSDEQKKNALWDLLNSETDEEGYRIFGFAIMSVYSDYAIAYDYSKGSYMRVYYKKDDASDSVEIVSKEPCYIIDVNETEMTSLKSMRDHNNGTYENLEQTYSVIENLQNENSELGTKNTELTNSNATLISEKDNLSEALTAAKADYDLTVEKLAEVTTQRDELAIYKKENEDAKKMAVINSYNGLVPEDVIQNYINNIDNYSCIDLDKELTYAQKLASPTSFSQDKQQIMLPKESAPMGGIELILSRYENKK